MTVTDDGATRIARRILVTGRVTGVAFRWHTRRKAEGYDDLRGYVRNVDRRTVECLVQGQAWMVEEMLTWLEHGPATARVDSIRVSMRPVDLSLAEFHISP